METNTEKLERIVAINENINRTLQMARRKLQQTSSWVGTSFGGR